ncbi:flavin reductase family protein [Actinopolymorpha alba]|uniref:flavin reductase family protein n=1 Tax=Actinopolymorpha alba TaxID=533267 RepID=UPI00035C6F24|nr:flavin reductase family protein [Actinopolymorpha alba]
MDVLEELDDQTTAPISPATARPEAAAWSPVDAAAYRAALARYASGVTIVTTRLDGDDRAMTATAFTSVSLAPPLVLVCVEKAARFHDAVLASGIWAVSVLAAGAESEQVASRLATRGRPLSGQFGGIATHRSLTGAPLLTDAIARLECRTWAVYDGGDHSILVGLVVSTEAGTPGDGPDNPAALVYYSGGYHPVPRIAGQAEDGNPPDSGV